MNTYVYTYARTVKFDLYVSKQGRIFKTTKSNFENKLKIENLREMKLVLLSTYLYYAKFLIKIIK